MTLTNLYEGQCWGETPRLVSKKENAMGLLLAILIWVIIGAIIIYLVRLILGQVAPQFVNIGVAIAGLLMLVWVIYHLGFAYTGTGL